MIWTPVFFIKSKLVLTEEFIQYLELFIRFEKDSAQQRQSEGIAAAHAKGVRFGRPKKMKHKNVIKAIRYKNSGYTSKEVANRFNVGRSTLLRYIAKFHKKSA